jgi:hypothetical protein
MYNPKSLVATTFVIETYFNKLACLNLDKLTRKEFLKNLGVKETVYGKMRNLSLDEMAEYIHNIDKAIHKGATMALRKKGIELTGYNPVRSKEAIKKWLQTEVQND